MKKFTEFAQELIEEKSIKKVAVINSANLMQRIRDFHEGLQKDI